MDSSEQGENSQAESGQAKSGQAKAEQTESGQAEAKTEKTRIVLSGSLTKESVAPLFRHWRKSGIPREINAIDVNGITTLDTSGIALLEWMRDTAGGEPKILYEKCPKEIGKLLEEFLISSRTRPASEAPPVSYFEKAGGRFFAFIDGAGQYIVLTAEIFYWSVAGILSAAQRRKHSVIEQCRIIGIESLPLVALLSIIIGVILSLQGAIQLRTFGANIYVADLMAISMVTEMGPMMSAILVAGRSGSAIASEISTMKVSEEIEALQVMGIDPIRYVVVPKFLAITLTLPILVIFSIYLGIGGGVLVGATSLEISPNIFIARSMEVVTSTDIIKSLLKSTFFGWVIVINSSYFGFSVSGGSEEVGKATTLAVVYSIIAIIVLDALFSLTILF
ncbi:MAG: MlaE family lipid ABC transporter permease subunit [Spirochaetia bacterium]